MGKSRKKAPKRAPKKATPRRSTRRAAPKVLTVDERQRVSKPREGWRELAEQTIEALRDTPRLKVPGLTASKLESSSKKADKAGDKERALIAAQQQKLRPVSDA